MEKLIRIESPTVVLPQEDIDTDIIIPAKYLTTTDKEGLGEAIFAGWRYDADGNPRPDFVLNQPDARQSKILVTGRNFGCGSSREHAPWGLIDYGFRAIVSSQIADIFRNNSLKNGLVPIVVDRDTHQWLIDNPGANLTVDVENRTLALPDGRTIEFPLDGFARYCLMEGIDQLGYLLHKDQAITQFEKSRAWQP